MFFCNLKDGNCSSSDTIIKGSFTSFESHSSQWHRVDSCQTLLSEEPVTYPRSLVVNKGFVLRWPPVINLEEKNTEVCSTNEEFLVDSSSDSVHKLNHILYMYVYSLPKLSFKNGVVYFFCPLAYTKKLCPSILTIKS